MTREIRVGDIVKITSDRDKLLHMDTGWADELGAYSGRLAEVVEVHHAPKDGEYSDCVAVVPTELDKALGITEPRSTRYADDDEPGWWFDLECVELVEESNETA